MSTSIGGAKPPHHVSHACADETTQRFRTPRLDFANFKPRHFVWELEGKVATVTLNRPERKNPLTFESYGELRDTFRDLVYAETIKSVVFTGAGGNFCSGGDVHEIIGPLVEMQTQRRYRRAAGVYAHDRRSGQGDARLPAADRSGRRWHLRGCRRHPGMASDLRLGTARSKVAFLFVRVGLAGADMGACNMLPRIIGAGRAAELLYTGRSMDGGEAERWGFYNRLCEPEAVLTESQALAKTLADGPTFAHAMTKRCIHQEWSMGIEEAIEAEAQAQAICMQTKDYERAYDAFVRKRNQNSWVPDPIGTRLPEQSGDHPCASARHAALAAWHCCSPRPHGDCGRDHSPHGFGPFDCGVAAGHRHCAAAERESLESGVREIPDVIRI